MLLDVKLPISKHGCNTATLSLGYLGVANIHGRCKEWEQKRYREFQKGLRSIYQIRCWSSTLWHQCVCLPSLVHNLGLEKIPIIVVSFCRYWVPPTSNAMKTSESSSNHYRTLSDSLWVSLIQTPSPGVWIFVVSGWLKSVWFSTKSLHKVASLVSVPDRTFMIHSEWCNSFCWPLTSTRLLLCTAERYPPAGPSLPLWELDLLLQQHLPMGNPGTLCYSDTLCHSSVYS